MRCCKPISSGPVGKAPAPAPISSCAPPVGTRIALKADTGSYFARCNGCQKSVDGKVPDTVTIHGTAPTGAAVSARCGALLLGVLFVLADPAGIEHVLCHALGAELGELGLGIAFLAVVGDVFLHRFV